VSPIRRLIARIGKPRWTLLAALTLVAVGCLLTSGQPGDWWARAVMVLTLIGLTEPASGLLRRLANGQVHVTLPHHHRDPR
jgi:hypothetical protein